ncbi:unnamed protein product [Hymenolepis diminuta]|uniref:Mannosyl-glycoprotein endo-beta-N-acetylglucosaminidase n=1 Tax=Hymenolepis diminuta TaxID=6216 RepID=A0A0R3SCN1_HYMDI|nr:unnamed protein product [Hymenolepis diminuta]
MAGGYLEYDTTDKSVPTFPTYRFVHWDLIDTFIYFSHHFITIPPVAWIDIAHKNCVKVYGTVIIERDRINPCPQFDQIFGTDSEEVGIGYPTQFAKILNAIRLHYGFEGWLINFENRFFDTSDRRIFQRVLHFLKCLKSLGSEVMWYDAVTQDGHLNWQNSLTEENIAFFHTGLDGIFLNYNWDLELLRSTQNRARSSDESMKIFVGVDCFGRSCPGGGGFDTYKALELILSASEDRPNRPLSVALFAPAWSFEKRLELDENVMSGDLISEAASLIDLDYQFWRTIRELIPRIRAIGNPSCSALYRPLSPWNGRLHTNFSLGLGLFKGGVFSPWSRLAEQQIKPNFTDYFTSGNSLVVDISLSTDQLLENFNLELFLFPNLSLSKNATLSVIIQFSGNVEDVCVFAHVSTVPWESVNTAEEYPVTGEQIFKHRVTKIRTPRGSLWTGLLVDIGSELNCLTDEKTVAFVRRIGLRFAKSPSTFLLGGFTLVDPQSCLL